MEDEKQLDRNKVVVRRFVEAVNTANYALLDELLEPGVVRHCQATPDVAVRSRDDFKRFDQQSRATFPDQHIAIETLLAEGDRVAVYATFSGTQTGPMGPFPATGKKVEGKFLSILRLQEGKIAELWVEWDNLALLTQLGHFPPQ